MHKENKITTTIERQWLDEIIERRKKIEYREIKPYWERRLAAVAVPFQLRLINGMSATAPEATVEVTKIVRNTRRGSFELHIGKVSRVKHWASVTNTGRSEMEMTPGKKAAVTRKRKAAGRKAALTRKRRAAGRKAAATRKRRAVGREAATMRTWQAAGKKAATTRKRKAAAKKAATTRRRRAAGRKAAAVRRSRATTS
jgi:hypothetical protein